MMRDDGPPGRALPPSPLAGFKIDHDRAGADGQAVAPQRQAAGFVRCNEAGIG
jgi:hypothetical protein